MEIIDNKAVLIRTRSPSKYDIIPRSKYVGEIDEGMHEVLVYWGLDEMRVLRNLGVKKAPSPINKSYDWPGKYKPFAHQRDTAAFLTLHRRAFCFNEPGCVDSETEYLSPTGWAKISSYAGGKVAQYHPDTGRVEFVDPIEYVKLPCEEMVRIKTKYGLDQLLSPEHRVLLHDGKKRGASLKTEVLSASELLARHDAYHAGFKHKVGGTRNGTQSIAFSAASIPTAFYADGGVGLGISDAALRVQVAVIADGHFSQNRTNWCAVRLKKPRKIERLRALLHEAQIPFRERAIVGGSADGFVVFTFYAPLRCKEFDTRFWECTMAQRNIIADEALHWDGTIRTGNKGPSFSTTSKASADFIQYAWSAQGRTARIVEDSRPEHYTSGACYTVQIRGTSRGGKHGLLSLRNRNAQTMSLEASTDGFKYCFRVPSTFLVFRRNGCVFCSGNTGKSMATLWAADYLMNRGDVRRALIICPLSIMETAWRADLVRSVMHRSCVIAHHSSAERRKEMVRNSYDFVITNYDGLDIISDEIIKDGTFDLIVVDEAVAYKNANTSRWKTLQKIINPQTILWMLTGTPAAQSPMDAFGLARLVNPGGVPKYMTAWRDKVMYKATQYKWVPKENSKDVVFAALQPAIRFTKAECLDLPPVLTEARDVPLTAQQKKYYKLLKERLVMEAAGEVISAVNAAAAVSKLLQVSAGAAYSDTKEVVEFDCAPRINVLLEVIEDTSRKVIVFAPFRHSISTIYNALTKHGISADVIHGDVAVSKRNEVFKAFQTKEEPRVLVIQPQAASHGVTLTAADTVVFWGPVMSVETYIQCCARADRQGQTSDKVTVIHLQGSEIERKMFRQLENRVADHSMLVKLYEEELATSKKSV